MQKVEIASCGSVAALKSRTGQASAIGLKAVVSCRLSQTDPSLHLTISKFGRNADVLEGVVFVRL
jgi:hypothetical protein